MTDITQSHAQKMLAAIEAVLEGKATHDVLELAIDGTQLKRMGFADLMQVRDRYRAEVINEGRRAKLKTGGRPFTTINHTFR